MPILDKTSKQFLKFKKIFRKEILILTGTFFLLLILWGGIGISDLFMVDRAQQFDQWLLMSVRDAENPELLIGPHWIDEAVRDVTALGGAAVLTFIVVIVVGYLLLQKSYRSTALVIFATLSGLIINLLLKDFFLRERPDIVPAMVVETSPSFPSGHSMLAAIIYLTLGSLLTRIETNSRVRIYTISVAIFITALVGLSRVLLGVHYPTDVLFGWMMGFFWASICWFVMMILQDQKVIEEQPEV